MLSFLPSCTHPSIMLSFLSSCIHPSIVLPSPPLTHPSIMVSISPEVGLLGAEAWKIGGIAAGVVVVLETLLIVVYILKCRTGAKRSGVPNILTSN